MSKRQEMFRDRDGIPLRRGFYYADKEDPRNYPYRERIYVSSPLIRNLTEPYRPIGCPFPSSLPIGTSFVPVVDFIIHDDLRVMVANPTLLFNRELFKDEAADFTFFSKEMLEERLELLLDKRYALKELLRGTDGEMRDALGKIDEPINLIRQEINSGLYPSYQNSLKLLKLKVNLERRRI